MLELHTNRGQLGLIELAVPGLEVDFSAYQAKDLNEQLTRAQSDLAWIQSKLTEARAVVADPAHKLTIDGAADLAKARTELAALLPKVDARRTEVRTAMRSADAGSWAWAVSLSKDAGLQALSPTLLALGNETARVRGRVENLREVIASIEGSVKLTPAVKESATRDLRAELAELEPKLTSLETQRGTLVEQALAQAQRAGEEDALLARGDFILGKYPSSGVDGTFERLLIDSHFLSDDVERLSRQVERSSADGLAGAKADVGRDEKLVGEFSDRVKSIQTQLAELPSKPFVIAAKTAYPER
jgi:hypothetical protein